MRATNFCTPTIGDYSGTNGIFEVERNDPKL